MFRTYTFSADFRTNKGFAKGDAFGLGAMFVGDKAGESKFGYNSGGISLAYHKSLNQKNTNYLTLGFSSQIFQQTIDFILPKQVMKFESPSITPKEFTELMTKFTSETLAFNFQDDVESLKSIFTVINSALLKAKTVWANSIGGEPIPQPVQGNQAISTA